MQIAHLEGVLSGEALLAVVAAKGLDGEVDALVALKVVVAVEGLGALVAFEGALRLDSRPARVVDVDVVRVVLGQGAVVVREAGQAARQAAGQSAGQARQAAHHGQRRARVVHVAQHGARDRVVRGVRRQGGDAVRAPRPRVLQRRSHGSDPSRNGPGRRDCRACRGRRLCHRRSVREGRVCRRRAGRVVAGRRGRLPERGASVRARCRPRARS